MVPLRRGILVALVAARAASLRIAVLITGHCDGRAHPCGEASWTSAARHLLRPLARRGATLSVFLCAPNGTHAAGGFEAAYAALGGGGAIFNDVDVYADDGGDLSRASDKRQTAQFRHRRSCYAAAGDGFDWYVVARPDFVYFADVLAGARDARPLAGADVSARVFRVEASCRTAPALANWSLTAQHLSTGWWAPCRAAVIVKAAPSGVLRVAFDDQFAVVRGPAAAAYFDGMLAAGRAAWAHQDVRVGAVVPLDRDPVKGATPEGYYTWGLLRHGLNVAPLALAGRLSRHAGGAGCQTCSLTFPPGVDPMLRARACFCSAPPADAPALACAASACRGLEGGRAKRPRVWSRPPYRGPPG